MKDPTPIRGTPTKTQRDGRERMGKSLGNEKRKMVLRWF